MTEVVVAVQLAWAVLVLWAIPRLADRTDTAHLPTPPVIMQDVEFTGPGYGGLV